MPREHPIVSRIKAREARKRDELEALDHQMAELTLRREAIIQGLEEDQDLLDRCTPKKPRVRIRAGKAETLGNELDAGPITGGKSDVPG
jgi:hypothetical protein